jgi:hypothetical protein
MNQTFWPFRAGALVGRRSGECCSGAQPSHAIVRGNWRSRRYPTYRCGPRRKAALSIVRNSLIAASIFSGQARADPSTAPEGQSVQRLADAWWTGPLLAANADTLPPGHVYFEPYLFDVVSGGSGTPGSRSYLLYGVAPRFTAGLLPSFSYAKDARGSRHLLMGDVTLDMQYRLTAADPGKTAPSIAINVQQRLPTARYDKLNVGAVGSGNGDYATLVGLYSQQYFWMPNGRILRARLDFTHTFEGTAKVRGLSVYGTPASFQGKVRPGDSTTIDLGGEYSVTKQIVLAGDIVRSWTDSTVTTTSGTGSKTPSSAYFAIAPAVEYNWSPEDGVIFGVRIIPKGRNSPSSVTPVVAYSRFF